MRTQRQRNQQTGDGCKLNTKGWQKRETLQPSPHGNARLLVESSFGRVLLHVLCLCRDGHLHWHWTGIRREFSRT